MNIALVMDFKSKYDEVRLVRHDNRTKYIECINYYPLGCDLQKIINEIEYGEITIKGDRIVATRKILN